MAKLIAALIVGLGVGAGAVLLVAELTEPDESISPAGQTLERPAATLTTTRTPTDDSQPRSSLADIQALPSEFERNAALYARLQSAGVGTVEALLDEAEDLATPRRVKQVIYSRYVRLDPSAALDRLRHEEADQLIRTTVSTVAGLDLDAALAFIDTLDEPLQARSARNILDLDGLSEARKEDIADRFGLQPYLRRRQATRQAESDPAGAWQSALAIAKGDERREIVRNVAETWFEIDPLAALSAVASLDAADRRALQSTLVHRWASQDPDAALQWALVQPGSNRGFDALREVAGEIAEHSPREMFELAEALDPPRRNRVAREVLYAWGGSDPVAALEALMAMKNAGHLPEMVGVSVVNAWAREDAGGAFEWVRGQTPSSARSSMLAVTLAHLGESDPERALTLAEELDGVARLLAIDRVLEVWGEESPRAAAAWLDERLEDLPIEAQRQVLPTVVRRLADESPDSALRLIEGIRDSDAKQAAGFQLIATWVETDPQAAVRAIARLDDSMSQTLYQFAFQSWSRFDPESATKFLDQIPSSQRDGAIQGVVQQTASSDPDLAEQLFERLQGDEARRRAAVDLFRRLSEVDPKRAERYRELSGATEHRRINIYR
ncbi:MAG: hypothetical protein OXQ90_00600 [Gammaproteobacteria bacterium]|nr:hypothetical protein [Gammaproteobacteria bacterium]